MRAKISLIKVTESGMIDVVQAYDRAHITRLETDDADALEHKLATAHRLFGDRKAWLKPHERIAVLRKAAQIMEERRAHLAMQIAREGGKPLADAPVETDRAINGVRNAAEVLRTHGGIEIPMGSTPATDGRRAWTIHEPIGVVAAISAFNHPLNLAVHQLAPAIAIGCPIIIKPASSTPLSCFELVGIDKRKDGVDYFGGGALWFGKALREPLEIGVSLRIDITKNPDAPLRVYERQNLFVSGPRWLSP